MTAGVPMRGVGVCGPRCECHYDILGPPRWSLRWHAMPGDAAPLNAGGGAGDKAQGEILRRRGQHPAGPQPRQNSGMSPAGSRDLSRRGQDPAAAAAGAEPASVAINCSMPCTWRSTSRRRE